MTNNYVCITQFTIAFANYISIWSNTIPFKNPSTLVFMTFPYFFLTPKEHLSISVFVIFWLVYKLHEA